MNMSTLRRPPDSVCHSTMAGQAHVLMLVLQLVSSPDRARWRSVCTFWRDTIDGSAHLWNRVSFEGLKNLKSLSATVVVNLLTRQVDSVSELDLSGCTSVTWPVIQPFCGPHLSCLHLSVQVSVSTAELVCSLMAEPHQKVELHITPDNATLGWEQRDTLLAVLQGRRQLGSLPAGQRVWSAPACGPRLRAHVNLSRCLLPYEDRDAVLVPQLLACPSLAFLDLSGNQLSQPDTSPLQHSTSLTELNLRSNWIDDAGAEALATALRAPSGSAGCLTSLDVCYNPLIKGLGARQLAEAVLGHGSLRTFCHIPMHALRSNTADHLSLDCKGVGYLGALVLGHLLKGNRSCTALSIHGNSNIWGSGEGIGDAGAAAIAHALTPGAGGGACNSSLTCLDLSHNDLSPETARALAPVLRGNAHGPRHPALGRLVLHDNRLGSEGAGLLAEALGPPAGAAPNTVLRHLDLSWNSVTAAGAAALAARLRPPSGPAPPARPHPPQACGIGAREQPGRSPHGDGRAEARGCGVTALILHYNTVGDAGARALLQALAPRAAAPATLAHLDLSYNGLGDPVAPSLVELLLPSKTRLLNSALEHLNFRGNNIGSGGVALIDEVIGGALSQELGSRGANAVAEGEEAMQAGDGRGAVLKDVDSFVDKPHPGEDTDPGRVLKVDLVCNNLEKQHKEALTSLQVRYQRQMGPHQCVQFKLYDSP